jgi:hypothetical protein
VKSVIFSVPSAGTYSMTAINPHAPGAIETEGGVRSFDVSGDRQQSFVAEAHFALILPPTSVPPTSTRIFTPGHYRDVHMKRAELFYMSGYIFITLL